MNRKKILAFTMCALIGINIGTVAMANETTESGTKIELEQEPKIDNVKEIDENTISEDNKASKTAQADILNARASGISFGKNYYITTTSDNDGNTLYYNFTVPKDGIVEVKIKNPLSNGGRYPWRVKIVDQKNGLVCLEDSTYDQKHKEYGVLKVGLKKGNYKLALKPGFYIWGNLTMKSDFSLKHYPNSKFETENNNTMELADYMVLNQDYKALGGDVDYFKFETKKKADLNILFARNANNQHSSLGLYNAKGDLLEIISENYDMVDRGPYKQYTHKNTPAGTYYLRAYGYDEQAQYILKVNQGATNQNKFTDISGHYAEKDIVNFVNKGYTNGYSDATFRPEQSITRAEFIKFVNKTFGFTAKGTEKFTDVNDGDWFSNDVKIAVKAGYVSTKNSKFRPNAPITREEVAKIIADIKNTRDNNLDKLNNYKDKSQVSSWAKSSVEGVIEKGYMGKGSSYFRPKANITRAEAVVTLNRVK